MKLKLLRRTQPSNSNKARQKEPVVINDSWGLRYIYYPWETEELKDIISREFYKPEFLAIKKLVKADDTVIDVGANVGVFSTYLSREVGSEGRVFAFEPVEETFWRLKETLAINRCENVNTYQIALSNKSGISTMNVFEPQYSVWNSFGRPQFGDVKPIGVEKVTANTLDIFTREHGLKKIDFVKIDVEGFEKDVLEGARNLLKTRAIGSLSFEISDIPLKGGGRIAQDVFDLLASFGYTAYRYDITSDKFVGPVTDSSDDYQNFYASVSSLENL
jgi:FkbM family methyltransferase